MLPPHAAAGALDLTMPPQRRVLLVVLVLLLLVLVLLLQVLPVLQVLQLLPLGSSWFLGGNRQVQLLVKPKEGV